jgi:hypothetical protein
VVNLLHWCQPTFLETLFTQRMLCGVAVTDALPRSAVFAVDIGTALVFIVFAAFLRAVLFTELFLTEVGTAGMRARTQRFLRHRFTSSQSKRFVLKCMQNLFCVDLDIKKATHGIAPMNGLVHSYSISLIIS